MNRAFMLAIFANVIALVVMRVVDKQGWLTKFGI